MTIMSSTATERASTASIAGSRHRMPQAGIQTVQIVTLAGDGIGPEIMSAAFKVLSFAAQGAEFAFHLEPMPFGGAGIDEEGTPLSPRTLEACRHADAILLAAIGGPKWDNAPVRPETGLLRLRQELGLFANVRPTRVSRSRVAHSPLRPEIVSGTDFVIVRELTSGIYFGKPRFLGKDEAYDTMRYSRDEIERTAVVAFETAGRRRRHVTLVDKANVLATSRLWRHVVAEVAARYPDVSYDAMYVDAAAMKLVARPTCFDVILTENLFGDILSDEAAQITGSLGTIPSRSFGASGPSLYEPIHGSAPDIAGTGRANPISMISSVSMMLRDSFAQSEVADRIDAAVDDCVASGEVTPDLGGRLTCETATEAVINRMKERKEGSNHD